MPFESNHHGRSNPGRGDAAAGKPGRQSESFLSPELQSLADQLVQDSQWLAMNYPAHKPRLPLRQPRRFRWVAVASVAVLVLLAIDGWWLWNRPAPRSPSPDNVVAVPAPVSPAARPRTVVPPITPAAVENRAPAALLKNLNGAEKEAVLDFLQERAQTLPKTSLPL